MERKREYFNCRLEVKSLEESEGTFTGYLSRFDVVDSYNDIVRPSAFTQTLKGRGRKVPLLWQHDSRVPIGRLFLKEDAYGLYVEKGEFNLNIPEGRNAYETLKFDRELLGLSIGFETIQANTIDLQGEKARELTEVKLYEGSLVTFPANEEAKIDSVKSIMPNTPQNIVDIVTTALKDRPDLMQALTAVLQPSNQATEQAIPPVQSASAPVAESEQDTQAAAETEYLEYLEALTNNLKEN